MRTTDGVYKVFDMQRKPQAVIRRVKRCALLEIDNGQSIFQSIEKISGAWMVVAAGSFVVTPDAPLAQKHWYDEAAVSEQCQFNYISIVFWTNTAKSHFPLHKCWSWSKWKLPLPSFNLHKRKLSIASNLLIGSRTILRFAHVHSIHTLRRECAKTWFVLLRWAHAICLIWNYSYYLVWDAQCANSRKCIHITT